MFGVLSATGRSPAEKRAELVSAIGFVEQDSFKAATALVAELFKKGLIEKLLDVVDSEEQVKMNDIAEGMEKVRLL